MEKFPAESEIVSESSSGGDVGVKGAGRTPAVRIGESGIWFGLASLFLLGTLVFLCACGGGEKKESAAGKTAGKTETVGKTETDGNEFVSPFSKTNALVIWTPLDPLDAAARAFEELIVAHNIRNPDQNLALLYVPEEEFDRRIARLEREDVAPDLFIVSDRKALEMAQAGLLLPLEGALSDAKLDRADVVPVAWRALESDGKLWGLPVCADLRLRFVNLDRMREGGFTTASLNSAPEERADWEIFRGGGALQIEEDFGRLIVLSEKPGEVSFRWAAFTVVGDRKVAEESLDFLAVAVAKRTRRSVKEMFPFFRASQSPAMASIVRAKGRRVPVLARDEKTREFLKSLPIRGPWLDAFGRESLLTMPEFHP